MTKQFLLLIFFLSFSPIYSQKNDQSKKNAKRFGTDKKAKEIKENAYGDEQIYKNYQNKDPKEDANKNVIKIDLTKAAKKAKSADMTNNGSGDADPKPKEKDITSKSPSKTQFVDDNTMLRRSKSTEIKDNSAGDVEVQSVKKSKPNLAKGIGTMEMTDKSIEVRKKNGKEAGSTTGDLDGAYQNQLDLVKKKGKEAGSDEGKINANVLLDNNKKRKNAGQEAGFNSGDLDGAYQKQVSLVKQKGKEAGSDQGKINAEVLKKIKSRIENSDREMGSNQGDIPNGYTDQVRTQKDKGHEQAIFQGNIKVRADLQKEKSKEIAQNQGDIIGSFIDKRNAEKSKSKQIASYGGSINLDKITQRIKENGHKHATHTGDILAKTVKERDNKSRSQSKTASSFEGNIVISSKRKGTHPSSVYTGGRTSDDYAAKERLRKRSIKKARKQRDVEDPAYMKKSIPKPRYETEEYKIWETKGR